MAAVPAREETRESARYKAPAAGGGSMGGRPQPWAISDLLSDDPVPSGMFEVVVLMLDGAADGAVSIIRLSSTDRVEIIKQNIQDKMVIPAEEQHLIFKDATLEDGKTAADCGITQGAKLHLVVKPRDAAGPGDASTRGSGICRPWCCWRSELPVDEPERKAGEARSAPALKRMDSITFKSFKNVGAVPRSPREEAAANAVVNRAETQFRAWLLGKQRKVLFVNRTDRRVHVFVFPGQEKTKTLDNAKVGLPTPVGEVSTGVKLESNKTSHAGAFRPNHVDLPACTNVATFQAMNIWEHTARRVHFMIATLDGSTITLWSRGDVEGGHQLDIQQAIFGDGADFLSQASYVDSEGKKDVVPVVQGWL